ncbi:TPA: glycosyltransferase family 4 protein [Photobacterium damselae]
MIIIGPKIAQQHRLGGVVVLFDNLLSYIKSNNIDCKVIDSNAKNYKNSFYMFIKVFFSLFCDDRVSLHGTARDFLYIGFLLLVRKKVFGYKYTLRKFAGNYQELYNGYGYFKKLIIRAILKGSSGNFFETKSLVAFFSKFNIDTYWFPNVRQRTDLRADYYVSNDTFKCLFLSQVMEQKGVLESIEAVRGLPGVQLTIAGKIVNNVIAPSKLPENVIYIGEIPPQDVPGIMASHHCLLLPTYYEGEGYPGVIIEAFMVGLPVISTFWRSIPELLDQGSGVLIPIKDVESITKSVLLLKDGQHSIYQEKSLINSSEFSDDIVNEQFFDFIFNSE